MSNVSQLKNKARREEQRENWSHAIELYTEALEASRQGGEAFADLSLYNRIGDIYLRIGQKNTAVRYYEQAIERYAGQDLHTSAIALCNKVLRIHPERSTIFLQLGRLHLATSLIADGRAHYHKYAESMRERGNDKAALEALEELIDETGDQQTLDLWLSWLMDLAEHDAVLGRIDDVRNRLISHGINPDQVLERVAGRADAVPADVPSVDAVADPLAGAFLSIPETDGVEQAARLAVPDGAEEAGGALELVSAAAEVAIPEPAPIEFGSAQWDDEAEELLSELNQPIEATWAAYEEEHSAPSMPSDASGDASSEPAWPIDVPEERSIPAAGEGAWSAPALDADQEAEDDLRSIASSEDKPELEEIEVIFPAHRHTFEPPPTNLEQSETNTVSDGVERAPDPDGFEDLEFGEEDPWFLSGEPAFPAEPPLTADDAPEPAGEEPVELDVDPSRFATGSTGPAEVTIEDEEEGNEEPAAATDNGFAATDGIALEFSEETSIESDADGTQIGRSTIETFEVDESLLDGDDWVEDARSVLVEGSAASKITVRPTPDPDSSEAVEVAVERNGSIESLDGEVTRAGEVTSAAPSESRVLIEDDPDDAFRDWVRSATTGVLRRALPELENRSEMDRALLVLQRLIDDEDSGVEYRRRLVDHLESLGRIEPAVEACLALATALELESRPSEAREAYLRVLRLAPRHAGARAALERFETVPREEHDAPLPDGSTPYLDGPTPYLPDHVTTTDLEPISISTSPMSVPGAVRGEPGSRPYTGVSGGADAGTDLEQLLTEFRAELHQTPGQGSCSHTELGASLKQMGRLDDAIRELQAAIREPYPPPLAFELLGEVFLEKGQGRIATRLLEKAVGSLAQSDREILGVLYQLGMAYESLTDTAAALGCYERIFSVDIDYRDIQERIVCCST